MTGRPVSPVTEDIANRIASENHHLRNVLADLLYRLADHWARPRVASCECDACMTPICDKCGCAWPCREGAAVEQAEAALRDLEVES